MFCSICQDQCPKQGRPKIEYSQVPSTVNHDFLCENRDVKIAMTGGHTMLYHVIPQFSETHPKYKLITHPIVTLYIYIYTYVYIHIPMICPRLLMLHPSLVSQQVLIRFLFSGSSRLFDQGDCQVCYTMQYMANGEVDFAKAVQQSLGSGEDVEDVEDCGWCDPRSWGYPQSSYICSRIFHYKASSYWGTPMYG